MLSKGKTIYLGLGLLMGSLTTFAKEGYTDYATPPEEIADEIIVFTPAMDMALNRLMKYERLITGKANEHASGKARPFMTIVQPANSMIRPLQTDKPVRMYLKRFEDRDEYYPIAIFPVSKGVKNEK